MRTELLYIPMCDLSRIHQGGLLEKIRAVTDDVITSGQFINEDATGKLEYLVQERTRLQAICMPSGTAALTAALMVMGIGTGDKVITSPYTFIATVSAILNVGAIPVFCDIHPRLKSIDLAKYADMPRAKAILPVYLFGNYEAAQRTSEIAKARGEIVIEDICQCFGSTDQSGVPAGAYAHVGATSFYPAKTLGACGDAGMCLTSNDYIRSELHKFTRRDKLQGNFRMDALQARILTAKLPYLDGWMSDRRRIAKAYNKGINHPDVSHPPVTEHYSQYVISFATSDQRNRVASHLSAERIDWRIYYEPLHLMPFPSDLGYRRYDFPEAEKTYETTLAIPIFPGMTDDEINRVCVAITDGLRVDEREGF